MKLYQLRLLVGDPINESEILVSETIEANDLVELLSKQLLVIAQIQQKVQERIEQHRVVDDDIPF